MFKQLSATVALAMIVSTSSIVQISKTDFYADFFLNFSKQKENFSDGIIESDFSITPRVGYALKTNAIIGIGVMYHQVNIREGFFIINPVFPFRKRYFNQTQRTFAPLAFFKYSIAVTNRINLTFDFNFQYGKTNIEFMEEPSNASGFPLLSISDKSYFFNMSLSPEFQFYLTKKVGMVVNFNGLDITRHYKHSASPEEESTEYAFRFRPAYWQFGAFVILGR